MLLRFVFAALAIALVPAGGHEKTFTAYPGDCDDSGGWYMKDSDRTSVTLACWQEDPTDEEPDAERLR